MDLVKYFNIGFHTFVNSKKAGTLKFVLTRIHNNLSVI